MFNKTFNNAEEPKISPDARNSQTKLEHSLDFINPLKFYKFFEHLLSGYF